VLANGERVVGLSLFAARDDGFGAKIVCPDRRFDLGETVSLALAPSDDPIRLGCRVSLGSPAAGETGGGPAGANDPPRRCAGPARLGRRGATRQVTGRMARDR